MKTISMNIRAEKQIPESIRECRGVSCCDCAYESAGNCRHYAVLCAMDED